jgi:hypothetical protein
MAGKDELVDELMPDTPDIVTDEVDEGTPPDDKLVEPPADDNDEPDAGDDDTNHEETAEEQEIREQQAREKKTGKFKPGKEKVVVPKAKPPEQQQQPPQTVPLAVLLQERNATKAELAALKAELEKLKNPPKVEPEPVIPDHTADPKGYVDAKMAEVLRKAEAIERAAKEQTERATQTATQATERTEEVQFRQRLEAAEVSFVAQNPDYYDALEHVREMRANQLRVLAPGISDQEIAQQIGLEEFNLARNLASQNRHPIAAVYQLAKNCGYQPKAPAEKLPEVKGGPKKLPPDQRLGSGSGPDPEEEDANPNGKGEYQDPFDDAFGELFGKKKRA